MKKIITTMLLTTSLLFSVGCSKDVEIQNTKEVNISYEQELYKTYQNIYPKMKKLFKELELDIKENNYIDHRYYSGPQQIVYSSDKIMNSSNITYANYELNFKNNNPIKVYTNIVIDVDKEELVNGFDMNNTVFANIDKIMIDKDIDYTEINKEILNACSNMKDLSVTKEYDNITCNIEIKDNKIEYSVSIYPINK